MEEDKQVAQQEAERARFVVEKAETVRPETARVGRVETSDCRGGDG